MPQKYVLGKRAGKRFVKKCNLGVMRIIHVLSGLR